MPTAYSHPLDDFERVQLIVDFTTWRADVTDYSLVLVLVEDGRAWTVRVYDGAHGHNELHRYTKKLGKQPAEVFHRGTLGEGMRTAIALMRRGYEEMVDGWRRG